MTYLLRVRVVVQQADEGSPVVSNEHELLRAETNELHSGVEHSHDLFEIVPPLALSVSLFLVARQAHEDQAVLLAQALRHHCAPSRRLVVGEPAGLGIRTKLVYGRQGCRLQIAGGGWKWSGGGSYPAINTIGVPLGFPAST
jgi:hypothetical protein